MSTNGRHRWYPDVRRRAAALAARLGVPTVLAFGVEPPGDEVRGAVVVCAGLLDRVVDPERVLRGMRAALDAGARAVLIATPDAGRAPAAGGSLHAWTRDELVLVAERCGLRLGFAGWTRAHEGTLRRQAIELIFVADEPTMAKLGDLAITGRPRIRAAVFPLRPLPAGLRWCTTPIGRMTRSRIGAVA